MGSDQPVHRDVFVTHKCPALGTQLGWVPTSAGPAMTGLRDGWCRQFCAKQCRAESVTRFFRLRLPSRNASAANSGQFPCAFESKPATAQPLDPTFSSGCTTTSLRGKLNNERSALQKIIGRLSSSVGAVPSDLEIWREHVFYAYFPCQLDCQVWRRECSSDRLDVPRRRR